MHPFLFIDFAMWLNVEFKYEVIKFVYDQLIQYRIEAGDTYREMAAGIASISKKQEITHNITSIAKANQHHRLWETSARDPKQRGRGAKHERPCEIADQGC